MESLFPVKVSRIYFNLFSAMQISIRKYFYDGKGERGTFRR
jgi:hypothetical protein